MRWLLYSLSLVISIVAMAGTLLAQRATFVREIATSSQSDADVKSVVFTLDGRLLSAGNLGLLDNAVCLWDPKTGKLIRQLEGETSVTTRLAISSNETLATAGSSGVIVVWDKAFDKPVWQASSKDWDYSDVAISPDGRSVATVGSLFDGSLMTPQEVAVWNVETGKKRVLADDYPEYVTTVAISPDGAFLVCSGKGKKVGNDLRAYDLKTGKLRYLNPRVTFNQMDFMMFSPDGKQIAAATEGSVLLLNPRNGQLQATLKDDYEGFLTELAFSPDGKLIATPDEDKTVRIWNARTGKLEQKLTGHTGYVRCAAFSPDGTMLVSGSNDGKLRIWKIDPPAGGGVKRVAAAKKRPETVVRVWHSANGKFSLKASLIRVDGDTAVLKREDGSQIKVGLERLSDKDQKYVRER